MKCAMGHPPKTLPETHQVFRERELWYYGQKAVQLQPATGTVTHRVFLGYD